MKVVFLKCGLGNQIFQYIFYRYLSLKGHKTYVYIVDSLINEHYGFELDKVIKNLKPIKSNIFIDYFIRIFLRLGGKTNQNYEGNEKSIAFDGFYFDKKYFSFVKERECIKLNYDNLSDKNLNFIEEKSDKELVAIHIRQGDYANNPNYMGICTPQYYDEAISIVKRNLKNPYFLFFSDNPSFVRQNFNLENGCVVDWNQGNNSYMDFLLMGKCKAYIIANSTFSYWAARLNENPLLVIYPKKWWNFDAKIDIFPNEWIGL